MTRDEAVEMLSSFWNKNGYWNMVTHRDAENIEEAFRMLSLPIPPTPTPKEFFTVVGAARELINRYHPLILLPGHVTEKLKLALDELDRAHEKALIEKI